MQKPFFYLLFVLLSTLCSVAQTNAPLIGNVKDMEGKPLYGAHVVAYSADDRVLTYATTDSSGDFRLRNLSGIRYVVISHLGYKPVTVASKAFAQLHSVTLQTQTFSLKEVAVKAERISESGDTLTYSVASFKQAQDRSIADVIRKMPGLEVKPNGTIAYQGKPINKFYIEGLDLMGGQYSLASNNLSANKVEKVQVLENHQAIHSLRHMNFNEQAALNIVLKDDAKSVWSGTADLGIGYSEGKRDVTYDNRLMAMQFNKNFQTLMMYKNNNNGIAIGSEVADIADMVGYKAESGLIQMMELSGPSFDQQRYTFNQSHILAGNWLLKTGKQADLRIQVSGFYDREKQQSLNSVTYLTMEGMPVITEDYAVTGKQREIKGEICYTLNTDRTYLRSSTKGYMDWNSSLGDMVCNDKQTPLQVKPYKRVVSEDFNLSHTSKAGNVWQLTSSTGYTKLPGQLLTLNGKRQILDLNLFSTKNELGYSKKLKQHFLHNAIGFDYRKQDINGMVWQIIQPYWKPSIQLSFAEHRLNAAVKTSYVRQSYESIRTEKMGIEPSFSWKWKSSPKSELSFHYAMALQPTEGTQLIHLPLFTSYRNLYEGCGQPDIRASHMVSAGYTYRNPVNGLFFHIRPLYLRTTGNILFETMLEGEIYKRKATGQVYDSDSYILSGRLAKSFLWSRTNVGLSMRFQASEFEYLSVGSVERTDLYLYEVSFDYALKPFKWWTLEGKTGATINKRNHIAPLIDWAHSLNLHFLPDSRWMLSLENEMYHSNDKGFGLNFFSDLALGYKTDRWELKLMANNIIGTSEYKRMAVSAMMQSYTLTYLRPREYMLKFSFGL